MELFARRLAYGAPRAIPEKFQEDRWVFVGYARTATARMAACPVRFEERKRILLRPAIWR